MKYIIVLLLLLFTYISLNGQSTKLIQGIITSELNSDKEYQIDVINKQNQLIKSIIIESDKFQIIADIESCFKVYVYKLGCEPAIIDTCTSGEVRQIDLGLINLRNKEYTIDEVTVTHKIPRIKMEGSKTSVTFKKSIYENIGSGKDAIEMLPGIISKNGELFLIGKGKPTYFIDGRQIYDMTEIENLRSQDIQEITINRNPSSSYDSKITSIIEIKTQKKSENNINIYVFEGFGIRRKVSNISGFQFQLNKNKIAFKLGYNYNIGKNELKENPETSIYYSTNNIFLNNLNYVSLTKTKSNSLFAFLNYNLKQNQVLSLQYTGNFSEIDEKQKKLQLFGINMLSEKRVINHFSSNNTNTNNFMGNYMYEISSESTLKFIMNYMSKKTKNENNINEYNPIQNRKSIIDYKSNNLYNIFIGTGEFSFDINDYKFVTGTKYTYIYNHYNSNFGLSNSNKINDTYLATYVSTTRDFNKINLELALRYEYNHTKAQTYSDSVYVKKRSYSYLLPSLIVSYKITNDIESEIFYNYKLQLPSFYEMNPVINYEDSLSITSGNPNIKTVKEHILGVNISLYNKLSIAFEYQIKKDEIIYTRILTKENSNQTLNAPLNLKKSKYYNLSFSYADNINKWNYSATILFEKPDIKVPEIDQYIRIKKTGFSMSFQNTYTISKHISIYCNLNYTSSSYSAITYNRPTNDLTLGIIGNFMNNRLNIRLTGTDILNGSNWNNWDEKYLNIKTRQRGDYDMTGVQLNITYKFNKITKKISSLEIDNEIMRRIN